MRTAASDEPYLKMHKTLINKALYKITLTTKVSPHT